MVIAETTLMDVETGNKTSVQLCVYGGKLKYVVRDCRYNILPGKGRYSNIAEFASNDSAVKAYVNRVKRLNNETEVRNMLSIGFRKLRGLG